MARRPRGSGGGIGECSARYSTVSLDHPYQHWAHSVYSLANGPHSDNAAADDNIGDDDDDDDGVHWSAVQRSVSL